ncbi:MAG: DUF4157 domain-containing protein [Nitrososphaeraceae archaeon]
MSFTQIHKPTTTITATTKNKDNIPKNNDFLYNKNNPKYQDYNQAYYSKSDPVNFNFSEIDLLYKNKFIQKNQSSSCYGGCPSFRSQNFTNMAIQPKLKISEPDDPYETEAHNVAKQVMTMPDYHDQINLLDTSDNKIQRKCSTCNMEKDEFKISIKPSESNSSLEVSHGMTHQINNKGSGKPLDNTTKSFMESRFNHNFSDVRIHDDSKANELSGSVNARAFTAGNNIFMGKNEFVSDKRLIAHELTHVIQQSNIHNKVNIIFRQPKKQQKTPVVTSPQARKDYVFIMGIDRRGHDNFFEKAKKYYKAHKDYKNATFVENRRNLDAVLSFIAGIKQPIGKIIIVSHGREDGTLFFGLNGNDKDARLSVTELREALHPTSGSSLLKKISDQVDSGTSIQIKGCNIGRNQEIVELIDEAFGGAGEVIAPTHEQRYDYDKQLKRVVESFSGPLFQRPGTTLFKEEELTHKVNELYGHLPERRRNEIAQSLSYRDQRPKEKIEEEGTYGQQGQRIDKVEFIKKIPKYTGPKTYEPPYLDPKTNDELIAQEKKLADNPSSYAWRVERTVASTGETTVKVIAERVIAYLHHEKLGEIGSPFMPEESDRSFFSVSH